MRARRSTTLTLIAVAALALGACGAPGSGGGEAEPTSSGSSGLATCDPIASNHLRCTASSLAAGGQILSDDHYSCSLKPKRRLGTLRG